MNYRPNFIPCLFLLLFFNLSIDAQDIENMSLQELDSMSTVLYKKGQYKEAVLYASKLYSITEAQAGNDSLKSVLLNNLGIYNIKAGKFKEAEEALLKALDLKKQLYGIEHEVYYTVMTNLSVVYKRLNRLTEAATLFQKLIQYAEKEHGRNSEDYARAIQDLAGGYRFLGRYEEAEALYLEAIKIRKKIFGVSHNKYASVINNLGVLYFTSKQYKKAEPLYLQTLEIDKVAYGQKHPIYAISLSNLADLYSKMGEYAKAEPLILQAIAVRKAVSGTEHPHYAATLSIAANMYMESRQYSKAFYYIYQAFDANSRVDIDSNMIKNDIVGVAEKNDFIELQMALSTFRIYHRIYAELYKETDDIKYLKKRHVNLQALSIYLQKNQKRLSNKKDKLKILKTAAYTSFLAINNANKIFGETGEREYLNSMITFAEYNKSAILSNALQSEKALNFGEVPDSLIQKDQKIKEALSDSERKLIRAKAKRDSASQANIQTKLIDLQAAEEALKKKMQENYPDFARLKYQIEQVKTEEIQTELLDEKSALLEYFVYDTTVYLILIKQDAVEFYSIDFRKGELSSKITDLRKGLSNYKFIVENKAKAFELYTSTAHFFYNKLIQPAEQALKGIEHLTIVADRDLGHIPFEVLLKKTPKQTRELNYEGLHYLINDYKIAYSYSVSLLLENNKHLKQKNNGQILAYAANYTPENTLKSTNRSPKQQELRGILAPLPAAVKEVEALQRQFGSNGSFSFGEESSEANFKSEATDFAVLHLAMHGILNKKHPLLSSLVFTENGDTLEDNFLEAHEISNLKLNNDLIVLSACETGYGKFEQGEGVMSLARSFMYAGVPSLVVSLWQVNDGATAIVMKYFYKNIANGMYKDEALRQAKLSYIDQTKGIMAHPAFWSAFIQIGDNHPIALSTGTSMIIWALGVVFLMIVGLVFINNKWSKKRVVSD